MFEHIPLATILVSYVAVLFSLSVHEAAHATAAHWLEDDTAKILGRMTLNPIPHMDVLGTLILPLLGAFTGLPVIGWAKPVPVDTRNLTRRFSQRVGLAFVAGAGPASNLLQSLIFLVALCLYVRFAFVFPASSKFGLVIAAMGVPVEVFLREELLSTGQVLILTLLGRLIIINVGLALFNLIPAGPLDGAGILRGFLPWRWLPKFDRIQPAMNIILLAAFFLGLLKYLLGPLYWLAETFYLTPLAKLILGV